jgi:hypothetical protein
MRNSNSLHLKSYVRISELSAHAKVSETEAQSNWRTAMAKENAKEKETKQLMNLGKT